MADVVFIFEADVQPVEFVFEADVQPVDFLFGVENIVIGAGGTVDIIDQDSNVIETVDAGDTYQVEVLTEIVDDEDLNTATIIDPLQ